jgi:hypothetical protein
VLRISAVWLLAVLLVCYYVQSIGFSILLFQLELHFSLSAVRLLFCFFLYPMCESSSARYIPQHDQLKESLDECFRIIRDCQPAWTDLYIGLARDELVCDCPVLDKNAWRLDCLLALPLSELELVVLYIPQDFPSKLASC